MLVTEVNPVHFQNAPLSIVVTELGMATEVKPLHPSKAELPIFVSVLGSSIDVIPTQFSKVDLPIVVRELDNEIVFTPIQLDHAVMDYDGHALLFVYIPEFREKPMYLRGSDIYISYIRSAGHTVRASRQQVRQMIADSEGVSYENRIAKYGLTGAEVLRLLNYKKLFELL